MQVVILGSGSPIPSPDRAGPSTLVRTSVGDLLFDAGRGVSMRATAAQSGPVAFRAVFLTHLHSDHITDLNDVITTRWAMSFTPNPLSVYGPVGTAALVAATEAMLEPDIGYRLAHHEDLDWRPRLLDVLDYHSSVPDAARTAARNGVGTLVLTHMVPAVRPGAGQEWIDQAEGEFDGTVVLSEDLTSVEVGPAVQ